MEEFAPQPAEIGTVRLFRYACKEGHRRHVHQQDDGGKVWGDSNAASAHGPLVFDQSTYSSTYLHQNIKQ